MASHRTALLLASFLSLTACSSSNNSSPPLEASTYTGTWTGTWTNTTFASTGNVSITVTESGGTFSLAFDMDGNVFGGSNPPVENLTATIAGSSATLAAVTSSTYGNLTATLNSNGTFTAGGTAIPGSVDTFTLTGTWNATTITANVTITFDAGGTANGTATLTKT